MIDSLRNRRLRGIAGVAAEAVGLAALYYLAGRAGLLLQLVHGQVTPLWPPTGIALVGLLLLGWRVWPGITLGAVLIDLPLGPSPVGFAAIVVGNTLAPLCGYLLLRGVRFRIELDRLRDALALVFLGGLVSMLISASGGAGALVLSGAVPPAGFWATWSVWWVGDAMGVLVFAPLLLVARAWRWPRGVPLYRWIEAAALLASTFVVTAFVAHNTVPLLFLVFPFLIWAALRFHEHGAGVATLIVSVVTIRAAVIGAGVFGQQGLFSNMLILQAFIGSAALTALLLAATMRERDQAHRDMERACAQLAQVVAQLNKPNRRDRLLDSVQPRRSPETGQRLLATHCLSASPRSARRALVDARS